MQREDVPARATAAGERLTKGLESIPAVTRVRGLGLLVAAELREPPEPRGRPRPRSTPGWSSTR